MASKNIVSVLLFALFAFLGPNIMEVSMRLQRPSGHFYPQIPFNLPPAVIGNPEEEYQKYNPLLKPALEKLWTRLNHEIQSRTSERGEKYPQLNEWPI